MTTRAPGWLWWVALVLPLWLVFVACTAWEPVMRDGWAHAKFHLLNDLSFERVVRYVVDGWRGSNPRLGQTLTLLVYTPGPYHAIITPLVELAMFYLLTTLALGRWPDLRSAADARVMAVVTAIVALCTPQFGPMLFYRPFTGNYLFGFVLNLLWLVPYRLQVARPRPGRVWLAPVLLVIGVAAGMCNEHTGPAFLGMGALAIVATRRASARIPVWMVAGLLGLLVGYVLLLVAPGQAVRYNALATEAGILERIVDRGVVRNLVVIGRFALYLLQAVPWLILGVVASRGRAPSAGEGDRDARRALVVLAVAGLVCTLTLLASPKLGPRLYLASVALTGTALGGWVCAQLATQRTRAIAGVLAGATLLAIAFQCVTAYRAAAPVGAARVAAIAYGRGRGSIIVVPAYPVPVSRWFLGDDFVSTSLRTNLAADYGIAAIAVVGR